MALNKKKSKIKKADTEAPDLNIIPFIDIFSMLNVFLLVSAAFIGLGIIEVQIPFLSNSPDVEEPPDRAFTIRVDIEEDQVLLTTQWTAAPFNENVESYPVIESGIDRLHRDLRRLREEQADTDLVTVYSDDNVKYEKVVMVIDAIKTLREGDPPLTLPDGRQRHALPQSGNSQSQDGNEQLLYEKVVIGSVIL